MSRKFNLQKPQVITIGTESGYIPKMLRYIHTNIHRILGNVNNSCDKLT